MRNIVLVATAAFAMTATGAFAETRSYSLDHFDRVMVATGLSAIVTQGPTRSVRIEAQNEHVLDQIEIRVRNGELRAKRDTNLLDIILSGGILNNLFSKDSATIHITMPELVGVDVAAGADVSADIAKGENVAVSASSGGHVRIDAIEADTISVDVSSGGGILLAGSCDQADLRFSSGGDISANDLDCTDVHVHGSSGASADISASGDVTGSVSSGANIYLYDAPSSVSVKSTSGGNLRIR